MQALTISVVDVNEPPTGILVVTENLPEAEFGTLLVQDPDTGAAYAYSFSDARFEVVGGKLKLKPGQFLNHEVESTLELVVTATDTIDSGLKRTETVTISVTNVNDPPSAVVLDNVSVPENLSGQLVGVLFQVLHGLPAVLPEGGVAVQKRPLFRRVLVVFDG